MLHDKKDGTTHRSELPSAACVLVGERVAESYVRDSECTEEPGDSFFKMASGPGWIYSHSPNSVASPGATLGGWNEV